MFVDDLNMPKLDRYGSQPPIELLRQYQDFGGFYDREKLFWKQIKVKITTGIQAMTKIAIRKIFAHASALYSIDYPVACRI